MILNWDKKTVIFEDFLSHLEDIAQRGTLDLRVWFGPTRSETFGLAHAILKDEVYHTWRLEINFLYSN